MEDGFGDEASHGEDHGGEQVREGNISCQKIGKEEYIHAAVNAVGLLWRRGIRARHVNEAPIGGVEGTSAGFSLVGEVAKGCTEKSIAISRQRVIVGDCFVGGLDYQERPVDVFDVDRKEYLPDGKDVEAFGPSADRRVIVSSWMVEELGEEERVEEVGWRNGQARASAVS
jgi:hypothetical protein